MPRKPRARGAGEGSVYQRPDGLWVAAISLGWRDGKRIRKTLYGKTRKEAAAKLADALAEQRRGRNLKPKKETLSAYLDRWHAEVITPNRRPNTIRTYRAHIDGYITPTLGDTTLSALTPQDVQRLLNVLRDRGLAPSTIRAVHATLHVALKQAARWELVSRNVAGLVERPRVPRFESNPLTPEEAARLLAAVRDDRLSALYELSIRLGPRQAEMMGLRWEDVDLDAGILRIRHQLQRVDKAWRFVEPKTPQGRRTVELSPHLVAALRRHRRQQAIERELAGDGWREMGLVFASTRGTPLDRGRLGAHLARALAGLGLPRRRWHDLRHTAVTLLGAAGVPERVIMAIVGHATLTMTRQYGAVIPASRRQAVDAVDALLAPSVATSAGDRRPRPRLRPVLKSAPRRRKTRPRNGRVRPAAI